MPGIQEWIYRLELGAGVQVVKRAAILLGLLFLAVFYDWRDYRNFSSAEAMDAGQLARHLATGRGYTTGFIRPFSMYLLAQHRPDRDPLVRSPHPDLANAPVYPVLLAGLMKLVPFHFGITQGVIFTRYTPEFLIDLFNQALFFLAVWLTFRLGKRLFDEAVASVAAVVLAGSALFWRFSISGLPTLLLVVIYLGIVGCLVKLEQGLTDAGHGTRWFAGWAFLCGALVGLAGLTLYSCGWLILPVAGFMALFLAGRRRVTVGAAAIAFVLVMTPWVVRNLRVSGTPFGTAGFAVYAGTPQFPGDLLERSLAADFKVPGAAGSAVTRFDQTGIRDFLRKLVVNTDQIVRNDLPRLGGSWITAFFLVGLFVPFMSPTLTRVRLFLVGCLALFTVVQALGRTHLTTDSPEINTENLLVVMAPLVFVFGAGMYFLLLDHIQLPSAQVRRIVTGGFCLVACAPMVFAILPPQVSALVYPPYYPPLIQQMAGWMKGNELMMSDMPWAVAWYGDRPCVWITLDTGRDFYTINDEQKAIQALYLSQVTLDRRLQTQLLTGPDRAWGRFFMALLQTHEVPTGFPLRKVFTTLLPEGQLYLSDWTRWTSLGR